MRLTELEKTILLAFLVITKGSIDVYLKEDDITSKFAMRKRKLVRISLERLRKQGFLKKHPRKKEYKFTKNGIKSASVVLSEGARLWGMG